MTNTTSTLKRIIITVAILTVFIYFVPIFHIVSLSENQQKIEATKFDASQFAEQFWQGPLLEVSNNAVDIATLMAALQQDTTLAAEQYGYRLGLSSNTYYFVSGQGHIVSTANDTVAIAIEASSEPVINIEIGPVFGNSIRDGSGLLDISSFSNVQDFNAVSSEINNLVEKNVLPIVKNNAVVGTTLRFVGAVEVSDYEDTPTSFNLIPVVIEVL